MSVHVTSPIWLVELPSAAWKAIAIKLGDCANDDGESIYPSVARIARETDADEATVRRALAAFEEASIAVVVSEGFGNRRHRSTVVRSIDLQKIKLLAAVDNRDGTFIPPDYCLKQIESGETRIIEKGKRKGECVPVMRWVVVERGEKDISKYDKLARPDWRHPSHGATPPLAPCLVTPRTMRP